MLITYYGNITKIQCWGIHACFLFRPTLPPAPHPSISIYLSPVHRRDGSGTFRAGRKKGPIKSANMGKKG